MTNVGLNKRIKKHQQILDRRLGGESNWEIVSCRAVRAPVRASVRAGGLVAY